MEAAAFFLDGLSEREEKHLYVTRKNQSGRAVEPKDGLR